MLCTILAISWVRLLLIRSVRVCSSCMSLPPLAAINEVDAQNSWHGGTCWQSSEHPWMLLHYCIFLGVDMWWYVHGNICTHRQTVSTGHWLPWGFDIRLLENMSVEGFAFEFPKVVVETGGKACSKEQKSQPKNYYLTPPRRLMECSSQLDQRIFSKRSQQLCRTCPFHPNQKVFTAFWNPGNPHLQSEFFFATAVWHKRHLVGLLAAAGTFALLGAWWLWTEARAQGMKFRFQKLILSCESLSCCKYISLSVCHNNMIIHVFGLCVLLSGVNIWSNYLTVIESIIY